MKTQAIVLALSLSAASALAAQNGPDPRPTFAPRPTHQPDPRPTFVPPAPSPSPSPRPTHHHPDPRPTQYPDPRPTQYPDPRPTQYPDPRPTQPAPQPTYTPVPTTMLRNYAYQQSHTVANRVAETYGAFENWRSNFVDGFWQAYSDASSRTGGDEWSAGNSEGRYAGRSDGDAAGRADARRQAESRAGTEARARFAAILDQPGAQPDLRDDPPRADFTGGAPGAARPDLGPKLAELDSRLQSELRALAFRSGAYTLYWTDLSVRWSLSDVFGYGARGRYRFVDDWFRTDFAYAEWRENRLGGGYDKAIYGRLDSDQRIEFQRYFKAEYDRVIDEKYTRVRDRYNGEAFSRGLWYGQRVGAEYARQSGYNAGYADSFRSSAIEGFASTFTGEYARAFQARVAAYQNGPVLELGDVRLIGSTTGAAIIAGDRLSLEIAAAANLGRRGTDAPVRLELDGQDVRPLPFSGSLAFAPSASLAAPARFADVAQVAAGISSDRPHVVTLIVGNARKELTLTVGFAETARAFARAESRDPAARALGKYLVDELRSEWKACLDGGGNCYSAETASARNVKLWQLVRLYRKSNSQEQANLRGLADEIRRISDDGGFWHPFIRRAFRDLVDQLR